MNASDLIKLAETELPAYLACYRLVNEITVECRHPAEDCLVDAKAALERGCTLTARRYAADVLMVVCPESNWRNLNVRPYASAYRSF